jgi:hypothetical protein
MDLNPWYITGLVEGEGCFSVSLSIRKKLSVGIEVRPSFSISLNERNLSLLKAVHQFFGCGAIRYSRSDNTYKYEIRSLDDLVVCIVPHFQKYGLSGEKLKDFESFVKICSSMLAKHHRNREQLKFIIHEAYQMNVSGKRKYDKLSLLKMVGE